MQKYKYLMLFVYIAMAAVAAITALLNLIFIDMTNLLDICLCVVVWVVAALCATGLAYMEYCKTKSEN